MTNAARQPRRRAVWATSQHWDSSARVSAHHYARLLQQAGWDVVFLSHPISPYHWLQCRCPRALRERWEVWRRGGQTDPAGVRYYSPMTVCPAQAAAGPAAAAIFNHWHRFTTPNLTRWLRRQGWGTPELVIIDSPLYGFLADAAPGATSVLRIVDDLGGFAGVPAAWVARERELIRRVDHVVVTSRVLEQRVRAHGPRSLTFVPNGVELAHFQRREVPPPPEYRVIPGPRAVYVGSVDDWFDAPLLHAVATRLPAHSFVLIGDVRASLGSLERLPNVHVLGRRPYEQLPAYLRHAAVGLMPFKRNRLTDAVHPIKLYEYLASGLAVVATRWDELERLSSPALLCDTPGDFCEAVLFAAWQPAGVEAAVLVAQSDWSRRADLLFGIIGASG